jgi:transcriptional regulator with XRE-family HTH domain
MSLGETIRSKREERDMTQQELADLLHVTRQTVSRWESGSRCPDLILSKKIADTFDISLDELVSSSDVDSYVPRKTGMLDIRKMLAAIFLLTLATWFMIYGFASNATVFAVISMILVFIACFMFVLNYFSDPGNDN